MQEVFSWSKDIIATMLKIKEDEKRTWKVWAFIIIKNVAGLLGAFNLKSKLIDFFTLRGDSHSKKLNLIKFKTLFC